MSHITSINGHTDTPIHDIFVCGRICLLGEHSDWASTYKSHNINKHITDGRALVAGTDTGLYCDTKALQSNTIELFSTLSNHTTHKFHCKLNIDTLQQHVQDSNSIFRYGCGVAVVMLQKYAQHIQHGISIDNYKTTLPVKKGLSSSAAYSVLVARSFNTIYKLNLTDNDIMNIAYHGERLTGSQCGQLDQICAIVSCTTLVDATFCNHELLTEQLKLTDSVICLVVVDLNAHKDTVVILHELNRPYINNTDSDISTNVQYMFGTLTQELVRLAVDVLHGINITHQLIEHEKKFDIAVQQLHVDTHSQCAYQLGRLMTITQHYFDLYAQPACPSQLTAPVLHKLLNDNSVKHLTYGGKWIGSGGDGSAQLIAHDKQSANELCQYIQTELQMSTMQITIGQQTT